MVQEIESSMRFFFFPFFFLGNKDGWEGYHLVELDLVMSLIDSICKVIVFFVNEPPLFNENV